MKKMYRTTGLLVLLIGVLVGCNSGRETSSSSTANAGSSSESASVSSSTEDSHEASSSISETPEATKSSSVEASAVSTEVGTSPETQAEAVLNQLAQIYPSDRLPTAILTAKTKNYVSAATTATSEQANYRILYYAEDQPIAVNSTELNALKAIASFERMTFQSEAEAKSEVGKLEDYGGQTVDLGFGITGYQQGAAGSTYLTWPEGNWNLTIKASNSEGEDPVALGKDVVAYLEEKMLPAPNTDGTIQLDVGENGDSQTNSVIWQEKNVVYKVHHFNAMQAVKMAASTNF